MAETAVADEVVLAPGVLGVELLRRGVDLDVWEAWDAVRDCPCVAKTLRPDRHADAKARDALLVEGRLLASLAHPQLVRAYELVEGQVPVLVLETLTGATLERLLADRGRLGLGDLCELGLQLASGVGYLHRQGWLHLDLKPSNVVCERGQAKLIDLSIARPPGRGRAGAGTKQYLAPEQAAGGELTAATDVWGLGAVLYEAASGVRPFGDSGVAGTVGPPLPIRARRRLPAGLARAIESCLERDPAARSGLAELAEALAAAAR